MRLVLIVFLLASLVACAGAPGKPPVSASATPTPEQPQAMDPEAQKKWDQFVEMESHFYQLENQHFEQITCRIHSSLLDGMMGVLRSAFARLGDQVSLEDTLDSYTLTYDKTSGLDIKDPTLEIRIKDGAHLADPEKVTDGSQRIQEAFKQVVAGNDQSLVGFFGLQLQTKKDELNILYINKDQDGYSYSATDLKHNAQVTGKFLGNTGSEKVTNQMGEVTSSENYVPTDDGKLLFDHGTMTLSIAGTEANVKLAAKYQKIGGIEMLQELDSDVDMTALESHNQAHAVVTLDNCKVR